jgi:hypothetical protein
VLHEGGELPVSIAHSQQLLVILLYRIEQNASLRLD